MNSSNKIVVALSGGADSVFLSLFLQKTFSADALIFAHFQHHLREIDAERDALFCEDFARQCGVVFERGDWENPVSSEEKARNARYTFLESVRQKHNAQWIALGHHQDDQAETILLQFFRGGSIAALQGMKEYDIDRHLWRPLLNISKSDILQFLSSYNQSFCHDISNDDANLYTRNFLRLEIIPALQQKFPNISSHLSAEAQRMQELSDYLLQEAHQFVQENPKEKGIEIAKFLKNISHIQRNIVKIYTDDMFGTLSYFDALVIFLQHASSGKSFSSKHWRFQCFGNKFFIDFRS